MVSPEKSPWLNFTTKLISLALIVVIVVAFNIWAGKAIAADQAVREQIAAAERAANRGPFNIADGVYEGTAKGYGGPVTVAVTMSNGYIEKVDAVSYKNEDAAWWDLAKVLLETIPEEQSVNVDTISTATFSSVGIINATKDALSSAPPAE